MQVVVEVQQRARSCLLELCGVTAGKSRRRVGFCANTVQRRQLPMDGSGGHRRARVKAAVKYPCSWPLENGPAREATNGQSKLGDKGKNSPRVHKTVAGPCWATAATQKVTGDRWRGYLEGDHYHLQETRTRQPNILQHRTINLPRLLLLLLLHFR